MPTLDELAMEYAMLAPQNYQSRRFSADTIEAKRDGLHHTMCVRFRAYDVQQAIRMAEDTLKLVEFHPPTGDEDV